MTTVELGGKTATGLAVPDEVVEALASGKRPPVTVILRGQGDLASAIATDAVAQSFWDSLSYSRRRRIVLSVTGTKSVETRARRIARSVTDLRDHKA